MNSQQAARMHDGQGFVAALDQSGGSTPKALAGYGVSPDAWSSEEQMFDLIHQMRTRVITSPVFTSERILAAILFQQTMERTIEGVPTAQYLWETKGIVPFLKIDKGLADAADGVQLMKPMPGLDEVLDGAAKAGIFGTKERSVIKSADPNGVAAIVKQQFEVAETVCSHGLVPILEPEVDIKAPDKADAEALLKQYLVAGLGALPQDRQVMLKVSIPSEDGFYSDLMQHPRVMRVVALSGGYSRDEADERLARNPGLIASFSRALLAGLSAQQSDDEFDKTLDASISAIYAASVK